MIKVGWGAIFKNFEEVGVWGVVSMQNNTFRRQYSSCRDAFYFSAFNINTILESVKKTNRLVILEEAWPFGNVSTEITYQVQEKAFDFLDAPIIKINTADTPAPYSPELLKEWLPNAQDVIKAVKKVMYK